MRYAYSAVDDKGSTRRGELEAASQAAAVQALLAQQLTPTRVEAARERPPRRVRRGGDATGRVAFVLLVRELSTLLRAGVTLEESLRTLIESRRDLPLEQPLKQVLAGVLTGERLSQVVGREVERRTLPLPSYVVALITAGESTGDLAAALGRAAEQLEFDEQLRAETSEALVYPVVLIFAGVAAVLFVFSFVVPRFSSLLAGRQADLPWLSAAVLASGEFVNRHAVALLVGAAAAALAGAAVWRSVGAARIRDALSGLPLAGPWLQQQERARWTGMLALMLQSRVPILDAIELTAGAITLPALADRLRRAGGEVRSGGSLSAAFATQELLPPSAMSMVRVGERSGQLGAMMGHVAAHTLEQNRRQRRRLVALIEPAAIVVLGGIIATVIVGVVLALTSLSDVKF